jgi:hypothetical protein
VWQAHRSHYYQRLVLMGWGHRRTALVEYGLMAFTGATALLSSGAMVPLQVAVLSGLAALYAGLAWAVDRRWSNFASVRN